MTNSEKAAKAIEAMLEARDIIQHLIMEAGERPDQFEWQVHIDPFSISLYDDGFEFASGDMNQFENPAQFMNWVMLALSIYYYDEKPGVEEDE